MALSQVELLIGIPSWGNALRCPKSVFSHRQLLTITGITVGTVALLLIEIVALIGMLVLWWEYWKDRTEEPADLYGGKPCGNGQPVAQGIKVTDTSWGTRRSWDNLMDKAKARAKEEACQGDCENGNCIGVPAVMDFDQTRLVVATHSWLIMDVYCECIK